MKDGSDNDITTISCKSHNLSTMETEKMSLVQLIFLSILVYQALGNKTEVSIEGCKRVITLGYGYKTMYHIREAGEHSDNHLVFKFYVKAGSDAHILLAASDSPTDTDRAYEIVIGAGKNSFTDIRNKGRKMFGAHVSTLNILSYFEYRGFWIKLSPPGHLEVGQMGSEAPIVFMDDPHPFVVRYFGFCSWASYIGEWAFSCPNETQADEVPADLTTLEKLRSLLLTHYDPYNRPVIQETDITTVYIQIQNKAVKLNEKKSTMSVLADVRMQWQDQKLQWNPVQHGNISKLVMAYHEIWQPDLMLHNAVGAGTGFLADDLMTVSPVGSVKWKSHIDVEVHCNLDLSEWPYDTQNCELQFGFWSEQKYLKLQYGNEPEDHPQQTNTEWDITGLYYENILIKTPWMKTTDTAQKTAIAIQYKLKRNKDMYTAVFGVPLLAISIMTLLPFWISPLSSKKLYISCLSLIIMAIFVITLAQRLPAPADHIPLLVQTYSRGMISLTFSILISVAVIAIARTNHEHPLPQIVQKLVGGKYVQFILFMSAIPNKDPADYGSLLEADQTNEQRDDSNAAPEMENVQQQWILLALLFDRLAFIIYFFYLSTVFFRHV